MSPQMLVWIAAACVTGIVALFLFRLFAKVAAMVLVLVLLAVTGLILVYYGDQVAAWVAKLL